MQTTRVQQGNFSTTRTIATGRQSGALSLSKLALYLLASNVLPNRAAALGPGARRDLRELEQNCAGAELGALAQCRNATAESKISISGNGVLVNVKSGGSIDIGSNARAFSVVTTGNIELAANAILNNASLASAEVGANAYAYDLAAARSNTTLGPIAQLYDVQLSAGAITIDGGAKAHDIRGQGELELRDNSRLARVDMQGLLRIGFSSRVFLAGQRLVFNSALIGSCLDLTQVPLKQLEQAGVVINEQGMRFPPGIAIEPGQDTIRVSLGLSDAQLKDRALVNTCITPGAEPSGFAPATSAPSAVPGQPQAAASSATSGQTPSNDTQMEAAPSPLLAGIFGSQPERPVPASPSPETNRTGFDVDDIRDPGRQTLPNDTEPQSSGHSDQASGQIALGAALALLTAILARPA